VKRAYLSIIVIGAILLIDQTLKFWIKTNMILGQEFMIFGWFRIHFLENEGMAFGMTFGGGAGKLILSILRIVVVAGIIWWICDLIRKNGSKCLIISVSLVAAGALGNIIDGCFYGLIFNDSYYQVAQFLPEGGGYAPFLYGKVVDMFYFPLLEGVYPKWVPIVGGSDFLFFRPVFNIADAAITIGVILFFVLQVEWQKKEQPN
jgi:signal peptidase II